MKRTIFSLILLFSLLLTGCASGVPAETILSPTTVTFIDDLGRTVTVDRPRRVACLLGSFAQVWTISGGEVIAAADDAWDDFALDLPADAVNLGNTKELSLEKLLAAEPDFIIASSNTRQNLEWQDTLESAGISTAYFDVANFADYLRMLKICTDITGRPDLYEENGLAVQAQINAVLAQSQQRVAENGAPTVLFMRASASSIRAKNSQGSVLGEMLAALGCVNIADSDDSLLENLSVESVIWQNPYRANIDRFMAENPAWASLTAVQEGRVYLMDKRLFNLKPNHRWGEAYQQLEDILANG